MEPIRDWLNPGCILWDQKILLSLNFHFYGKRNHISLQNWISLCSSKLIFFKIKIVYKIKKKLKKFKKIPPEEFILKNKIKKKFPMMLLNCNIYTTLNLPYMHLLKSMPQNVTTKILQTTTMSKQKDKTIWLSLSF